MTRLFRSPSRRELNSSIIVYHSSSLRHNIQANIFANDKEVWYRAAGNLVSLNIISVYTQNL